jgi:hypothetical protein
MAENSGKPSTDEELQKLAESGAALSEIAELLARAELVTKAPREPWPHAPRSSVNKITWAQVGRVTDPGRYMFTFGWLTIAAEDLALWVKYPNAAFTLYSTAKGRNRAATRKCQRERNFAWARSSYDPIPTIRKARNDAFGRPFCLLSQTRRYSRRSN